MHRHAGEGGADPGMPWVTSERMSSRFQTTIRAAVLACSGFLLTAAGQFPAAPLMAVHGFAIAETASVAATPADKSDAQIEIADGDAALEVPRPTDLTTLVARLSQGSPAAYGDRECLARAVYFEARGEPLAGQLAVAQVILNRVASGRFADTVCAVIAQRGQFSFDRSRTPTEGRDWRTAKAIAAIAATDGWDIVAPRATAFHATRIAANWTSMRKVSTIGNHVFYR